MSESTIARVTVTRTVKINLGDYSNTDVSVSLEGVVPVGALWESTLHQIAEETEIVLADEMDILMTRRVRVMVEQWGDARLSSFLEMGEAERAALSLRLIRELPGYTAMLSLAILRWDTAEDQWAGMIHDAAATLARKRGIEIKGEDNEPTKTNPA